MTLKEVVLVTALQIHARGQGNLNPTRPATVEIYRIIREYQDDQMKTLMSNSVFGSSTPFQ